MGSRSRRILAIALLVLTGLLVPVAVVATWTARTVTDTESFVSRVAPVASQPEVQALVSHQIADQVTGAVIDDRVAPRVGDAIDELAAPELVKGLLRDVAASLVGAVETRVQNVADKIVTPPEFQSAFDTALEEAHAELVATLEGDEPQGAVITEGATVMHQSGHDRRRGAGRARELRVHLRRPPPAAGGHRADRHRRPPDATSFTLAPLRFRC